MTCGILYACILSLSIHFTALSCVTGPVDVRSSLIRHAWLLVMLRPILYAPYIGLTHATYLQGISFAFRGLLITEIAANSLLYPTVLAQQNLPTLLSAPLLTYAQY